jgi:hypothetical protein
LKGRWYRLEKFSSMGNGFTFELETLIFATLARTVVSMNGGDPSRVSCYGDDLIVPSSDYKDVMAALRMFGFQPNMKKTFAEGPFRESCGGDYWAGVPVRGLQLENLPDEPQHWIALAYGLRRVAMLSLPHLNRWSVVKRAWLRALDAIPVAIRRLRGPEYLGDIVIHDDPGVWLRGSLREDDQIETVSLHAYLPVPVVIPWTYWKPSVQLASCTLGLSSDGITPRGGVSGYRIGKVTGVLASQPCTWLPNSYLHP